MKRSKAPKAPPAVASPSHAVAAPRYYHAADRFGAGLLFYLPFLGVLGSFVLGWVYAFLAGLFQEVESPAWMVVVTPMYAAGLALLALGICRLGNVRGRRLS